MFWVVAAGMALVVTATLVLTAMRAGAPQDSAVAQEQAQSMADDPQMSVYRDQLEAVARDVARGTVAPEEAERLRTEIARRLLDADKARAEAPRSAPRTATLILAAAIGTTVIGGALLGYARLGAPGYPDLPLAHRLELAAEAAANRPGFEAFMSQLPPEPKPTLDPEFADLYGKLQAALEANPDDPRGLELMVQFAPRTGDLLAAAQAQGRLNRLPGATPTAEDWANEADLLILATQGYVSPEAEAALQRTLQAAPRNPVARFYMGLMYTQTGRPDLAFAIWRPLLEESQPEDPWVPPIRSQIEEVATAAGIAYELPPIDAGTRGPSAADIEAASEMDADDRMAMIENMVEGLSTRLAEEGGGPAEWAQLIRALGVLGRVEQAATIWLEAQRLFTDPDSIAPIREAARAAGVAGVQQ